MSLPNFLTEDHLALVGILQRHDVEFLLVGGVAVNYYGYNRSTGDIDIFYRRASDNAQRLFDSLQEFFAGEIPGIDEPAELLTPGLVVQFGVPPHRIDLVNDIDGVDFETSWKNRRLEAVDETDIQVPLIDLQDLLANKRASDRPKDQDDFQYLSDIADKD